MGVGALVLVHYFDAIYILKISAPSNVVKVKTDKFRETQNLRKLRAVKKQTLNLTLAALSTAYLLWASDRYLTADIFPKWQAHSRVYFTI